MAVCNKSTERLLQLADMAHFKSDKALANLERWLEERRLEVKKQSFVEAIPDALNKIRAEQYRRRMIVERSRAVVL